MSGSDSNPSHVSYPSEDSPNLSDSESSSKTPQNISNQNVPSEGTSSKSPPLRSLVRVNPEEVVNTETKRSSLVTDLKPVKLQSASQDLISPEEMKGVDLSLPAEASAFHRKPWAMTLDILQRLPTPTDRATFQSLEVTENIDNTMRNLFLVIHTIHTFSLS